MKFSNLVDLLHNRSQHQPDQKTYTFLQDGEIEASSLTYEQLELQARAIAAYLQSINATGERVLLLYPPGLEFIAGFFGCLYAGAIAIPAYPPRPNQSLSKLQAIATDAEVKVALTTSSLLVYLKSRFALVYLKSRFAKNPELARRMHWLATDNIASSLGADWQKPTLSSDTLAFLQYTSGSTGTPKGVMITHSNLMHNLAMNHNLGEFTSNSRMVTWLPFGHNTGLIAGVIQPVYSNFPVTIMSPLDFLQKPLRWLMAISRYKATYSGAPNFAYDMACLQTTAQQRATLDLSNWEVALNGAEPVRAETIERFVTTFTQCGFRREAFSTVYGMAESVLVISSGLKKQPPVIQNIEKAAFEQNRVVLAVDESESTKKIVGCGRAWLDQEILIVNPVSLIQCQPLEAGEIWVSSPSVAQGYWNRPDATKETFHGYLADTHVSISISKAGRDSALAGRSPGPFLRTGDLGFLLNGELFITGRLKDLIIIRGRNYYPQDIELIIEKSHPALQPSSGAAFSVEVQSEERLVIVCEVQKTYLKKLNVDEVVAAIRQAVSQQHDLQVYAVLLLNTGSIPKTGSNKIQRHACRMGFLDGSLNVVGQWQQSLTESKLYPLPEEENSDKQELFEQKSQTAETIQAWLVEKISQQIKLNLQDIDVHEPLTNYALDSVQTVNISGELENWLGRKLSPSLLWDYHTIEQLVQHLVGESKSSQEHSRTDWNAEVVLDATISPGTALFEPVTEPAAIFITGTTGFLGAFLLHELLEQTQADIYCLVRSANEQSGKIRIQKNLETYGLWNQNFSFRIIPVLGDVSQPQLGLSAEQFQSIASQIDTIYHSAALLNYVYPYERLKPINVLGTQEVLRLASQTKVKPLHYISSVGVFESSAYYRKVVSESDQLLHSEDMYLGYSQSKWVAEKLVMMARERGLPVCIYRPPFISGHSQTGVWNTNDIICRIIKGYIQMESMPDLDSLLDLSPVDYVSRAIVYLSRQKESLGKAFHLNNPQPIHWSQVGDLLRYFGYSIKKASYEHWLSQLNNTMRAQDNPLYPLLPFFIKKWSQEQLTITELHQQARRPQISCHQTLAALTGTNIFCPPVKGELLNTYFSYFIRSNFLDAP
ncbi:MAG: thioester reductase domain-containing protein [Iphinoe sp. HA4291-MV1]|jgi:thioester reductase-like protein|nr:thioester reductase domain-containing protein [Iphinoe sp. HA4291-MV1]